MTLDVQFLTMVSMVAGGFYLGIVLDVFRRLMRHWQNNVFLLYFMEICFWLTQTLILYYLLFRVNGGELRVYIFGAGLLGFSAYQAFATNRFKKLLEHIIVMVSTIYSFFTNLIHAIIIVPSKFIFSVLFKCILTLINVMLTVFLFILKMISTPITWGAKKLYHMLPTQIKKSFPKIAGIYSTIKNICIRCKKYFKFKRR